MMFSGLKLTLESGLTGDSGYATKLARLGHAKWPSDILFKLPSL